MTKAKRDDPESLPTHVGAAIVAFVVGLLIGLACGAGRPSLDAAHIVAQTLQSGLAALGIIAAGSWTYLLYVKRRQIFPRAEVSHRISCVELSADKLLVHVVVVVKNIGEVLITLVAARVEVHQVRPLTAALHAKLASDEDPVPCNEPEVKWPIVGEPRNCDWAADPREIEPHETDEYPFDFVIPGSSCEIVEVYSHFKNVAKVERPVGWNLTTLCSPRDCLIKAPAPKEA